MLGNNELLRKLHEERKAREAAHNQPVVQANEKEKEEFNDSRLAFILAKEEAIMAKEKANQEDATYVVNFLTSAFDREIARKIVKDDLRQETDEAIANAFQDNTRELDEAIAHSLQSEMLAADLQQEEDEALAKALANRPGRK